MARRTNPAPDAAALFGGDAVAAALAARGYRPSPAPAGTLANVLWLRRVGEREFVEILAYRPLGAAHPTGYEIGATFDRGTADGTFGRVRIFSLSPEQLLAELPALEATVARARAALTGAGA